jgi:predicted TIM-barrel fold metal-dependent hydrolase
VQDVLAAIKPYVAHVFESFPRRVMFGSDWPVCNVGGPRGEAGNWGFWRDVVEAYLADQSDEEAESVWWRAAAAAYEVDV